MLSSPSIMSSFNPMDIREINGENELNQSVEVIQKAFSTVARDFGLTKENCPTHGTFMTLERLQAEKDKGIHMFALFVETGMAGFVALEKAGDNRYYLEKLSVLPEYRKNGYGKRLMDFAFQWIKDGNGEKCISIAVIQEHQVLKDWYLDYGFTETGVRHFDHLPFSVCFMEKKT